MISQHPDSFKTDVAPGFSLAFAALNGGAMSETAWSAERSPTACDF